MARRHRRNQKRSGLRGLFSKPLTQHQKDFRSAVKKCKGLPSKPHKSGQFQVCMSKELKRIKSNRGD